MASLSAQRDPIGGLSPREEAALRALHHGRHFGIDPDNEHSLVQRGLVALDDRVLDGLVFHDLPILTPAGAMVAAHLVAEQELVTRLRRTKGGFTVLQGGLA